MSNYIGTTRLDANRVRINVDFDIVLFANEQVPVDRASLQEIATIAEIRETIEALNRLNFFGDYPAKLHRAVLTPDFHKGAGIPVGTVLDADGFVLPRTAGTDIGCGMRLIATSLKYEDFFRCLNLDDILRHAFFEGGRDIPMDEEGRIGMLREGVLGLRPLNEGIWRHIDPSQMISELDRTHRLGTGRPKTSGCSATTPKDRAASAGIRLSARSAAAITSAKSSTLTNVWTRQHAGNGVSRKAWSPSWLTPAPWASVAWLAITMWTKPASFIQRPTRCLYAIRTKDKYNDFALQEVLAVEVNVNGVLCDLLNNAIQQITETRNSERTNSNEERDLMQSALHHNQAQGLQMAITILEKMKAE